MRYTEPNTLNYATSPGYRQIGVTKERDPQNDGLIMRWMCLD
jgi:hypothetical protein